jgi:hypothetical protein
MGEIGKVGDLRGRIEPGEEVSNTVLKYALK